MGLIGGIGRWSCSLLCNVCLYDTDWLSSVSSNDLFVKLWILQMARSMFFCQIKTLWKKMRSLNGIFCICGILWFINSMSFQRNDGTHEASVEDLVALLLPWLKSLNNAAVSTSLEKKLMPQCGRAPLRKSHDERVLNKHINSFPDHSPIE